MNEERPIEKLLRRYAQKRRDESGPPPELHPATRRLLQGEVARQFPPARPARAGGCLALLRARWIYATACVVVVGVGIVLFRFQESGVAPLADNKKEFSLAKADSPEPEAPLREAPANRPLDKLEAASNPAPPSAAPIVAAEAAAPRVEVTSRLSFDDANARRKSETQPVARTLSEPARDRYGVTRTDESLALRPKSQPPATIPAPVLAESKPAPVGLAGTFAAAEAGKDVAVVANPIAGPPPARKVSSAPASEERAQNSTLARGGGLERENRATLSQAFANLTKPSETDKAKRSPAANVLVNFRVEQTGDRVQVIDSDGSTYLGLAPTVTVDAVVATDASKGATAFSQPSRAQTATYYRQPGEAQAQAGYLYRVEGTNRTLQQSVSFAWNFVAPTNLPGAPAQSAGGPVPGLPQAPWVNSAINGQVQINTGAQFELNAMPIER